MSRFLAPLLADTEYVQLSIIVTGAPIGRFGVIRTGGRPIGVVVVLFMKHPCVFIRYRNYSALCTTVLAIPRPFDGLEEEGWVGAEQGYLEYFEADFDRKIGEGRWPTGRHCSSSCSCIQD